MKKNIDNLCVNAIRLLGMDMINKAKSGHPGIVLGAAPIIHTLFTRHLRIDPIEENWVNRDRFILSAGHGSAMLYATLHLSGFNITIEDLKNFRQLGSKTPGHPEVFHTPGVETTTGPLGQGVAMAVGMAIAERFLGGKFNRHDIKIINHHIYALCGDGDLQEGVCQEALSLAGTLGLNKLIILYDSNDIQLDGEVKMTNKEDVKAKYEAMNFHHILVLDGTDCDEIDRAITEAKAQNKPTIIEVKTQIGYGSPNAGDCAVHGAPLGGEVTQEVRDFLEWPYPETFYVPEEVMNFYQEKVIDMGEKHNTAWNKQLSDYQDEYPFLYHDLEQFLNNDYELDMEKMPKYDLNYIDATRNVSGFVLNEISKQFPQFIGGSADLTKTTKAKGANGDFTNENRSGRNILYGVREHAMGAIANGIILHSNLKTFTGGFLVFSDYMKPALRLAALMGIPTIYVFSHDSIAVGEDGPTHEPIEQLTMLRSIPNFNTFRPADANETVHAFSWAIKEKRIPSAICTTRQNLPTLENTSYENVTSGGYIIYPEKGELDGIIIASGSEVSLAIEVAKALEKEDKFIRVVSMPSMYLFDNQTAKYKNTVIPKNVKTMALEMAYPMPWYKYSPNVYGISTFGYSGKEKDVMKKCGFTVEDVVIYYKEI